MDFLEFDSASSKNIYLDLLEDIITLLCDFREKVIKEIEDDEL